MKVNLQKSNKLTYRLDGEKGVLTNQNNYGIIRDTTKGGDKIC